MKKTLNQLFWETRGPSVEYEGRTVHRIVVRNVKRPGRFLVRFLEAAQEPIQALSIDIERGNLIVQGVESRKVLLRFDTGPGVVLLRYQPSRNGSDISFYNSWIDEDGLTLAWENHSGMLLEETGSKMILHCSDGWEAPTFDNLVVEIEFLKD